MRIRLQLLAPFEESKALVLLPSDVQTIHELKRHLRQSLSTILALTSSPKDLLLEIDGFELLPGSSTNVIEPTDVVTVRLRAGSSKQELGNRKRSSSREIGQSKKRKSENGGSKRPTSETTSVTPRARTPSPAASTNSSSSSSSSETASNSSSDSSSSSSSSSTSSSSSSSARSSDRGPLAKSNPPLLRPPASLKPSISTATGHVKPGEGKMSTKERNERRRIARRMQKQAEEVGIPLAESRKEVEPRIGKTTTTSNGEGGGSSVTNAQSESSGPEMVQRNKKKKGSLKETVQGTKTVFGTDAQASSTPLKNLKSSTTKSTPNATPNRSSTWAQSRMIPPSELEVLPSNVFFTHVEYQRNGWTPRQRSQRAGKNNLVDTSTAQDEADVGIDQTEDMDEEALLNDSVAVDDGQISRANQSDSPLALDATNSDIWTFAESRFDTLPPLKTGSMPSEGTVLGWKELLLDPYTFSPQLAIQLGTLKSLDSERAVVQRLQQYEAEEEDQLTALDPEVVINLSDLGKDVGKYRIVKRSA